MSLGRHTHVSVAAAIIATLPGLLIPASAAPDRAAPGSADSDCQPVLDPVTVSHRGTVATVVTTPEGGITWRVSQNGSEVLSESALGLERVDAQFVTGMSLCDAGRPREVLEDYTLGQGKVSAVRSTGVERDLTFAGENGERFVVTVRTFADGAAVRYAFPDLENGRHYEVARDSTQFSIPAGDDPGQQITNKFTPTGPKYQEWYVDRGEDRRFPALGQSNAVGWSFPATFYHEDPRAERWTMISEAGLDGGYPATHLDGSVARSDGTATYAIDFPDDREALGSYGIGNPVIAGKQWTSPWRYVVSGRSPEVIVETTATTDLAADPEQRDWSWVDPGAASFSWFTGGEASVATLEEFQPWIDLSVDMGWEYVLADAGWPAMKDAEGDAVSLEELAGRVSDQGAALWVWINSGGPNNNHPGQPQDVIVDRDERRTYFKRLQDAGVKGIKVDIWESDKQGIIAQQRAVLQDAADFELMVTFHNTTIPRGWEREFPHLLSVEAAIGGTYEKGPDAHSDRLPEHNTILPFTRLAVGGFDYSPTALNTDVSPTAERRSTAANQLALAVLMQSGMLTYGGAPEGYLDQPDEVREYVRQVPGHYDEVAYLGGRPGDSAIIGRRSGDTWYIAAVNGKTEYISPVSNPTQPGYQPPVGVPQTLTARLGDLHCSPRAEVTLLSDLGHNEVDVTEYDLGATRAIREDTLAFGGFAAVIKGC